MLESSGQADTVKAQLQAEGELGDTGGTRAKGSGGVAEEGEAEGEGGGGQEGAGNLTGPNGIAPPPQMVASQAEALATLLGNPRVSIQALDFYRVPLFLLPIYQAAASQYGVPWQVLAAINEVETDYGNDLNVSTAGAVGWMQFMPQTWLQYGVDVQDAGYADPYNPVDAIFAAARYLRAAGASKNLQQAVFAYNHSQAYVESVMLRAKLIAHYPSGVIATLTGLAEGQMPVKDALATGEEVIPTGDSSATPLRSSGASKATEPGTSGLGIAPPPGQSARSASSARPRSRRFVELSAPAGAPVVAVQDGKVIAIGRSRRLGRYVVVRDVFGDVFTYAGLGSVARTYRAPSAGAGSVPGAALAGAEATSDPTPSSAATAGSQPPETLKAKSREDAEAVEEAPAQSGEPLGKVRMYAHPGNHYAKRVIAKATAAGNLAGRTHALRVGSVVTQGTALGGTSVKQGARRGVMKLAIDPAGDAGTVDAEPVLQSWRQLYAALHPQGARRDSGLLGATAGDAFLLGKPALEKAVLADPGVTMAACARHDVEIGAIGTRPLATLVFLSRSGLKPTLSSLPCERRLKGGYSAAGSGVRGAMQSLAIDAVNGVPIAGHEGPRSIADLTIRTLLTLEGRYSPAEIVSLMRYPGAPQTIASRRRPKSILVVFSSSKLGTTNAAGTIAGGSARAASAGSKRSRALAEGSIGNAQWQALVHLIGSLPQSKVSRKRSSAAISDPQVTGGAGAGRRIKP